MKIMEYILSLWNIKSSKTISNAWNSGAYYHDYTRSSCKLIWCNTRSSNTSTTYMTKTRGKSLWSFIHVAALVICETFKNVNHQEYTFDLTRIYISYKNASVVDNHQAKFHQNMAAQVFSLLSLSIKQWLPLSILMEPWNFGCDDDQRRKSKTFRHVLSEPRQCDGLAYLFLLLIPPVNNKHGPTISGLV